MPMDRSSTPRAATSSTSSPGRSSRTATCPPIWNPEFFAQHHGRQRAHLAPARGGAAPLPAPLPERLQLPVPHPEAGQRQHSRRREHRRRRLHGAIPPVLADRQRGRIPARAGEPRRAPHGARRAGRRHRRFRRDRELARAPDGRRDLSRQRGTRRAVRRRDALFRVWGGTARSERTTRLLPALRSQHDRPGDEVRVRPTREPRHQPGPGAIDAARVQTARPREQHAAGVPQRGGAHVPRASTVRSQRSSGR